MYKIDQKKKLKILCLAILVLLVFIIFLFSFSNKDNILIKRKYQNPTATIFYETKNPTNKSVMVKLINPSTEIEITNNSGNNEYIFEENGEFTFEFVDKRGNKGFASAKVDWIDKTPPIAQINYDKTELTNQDVKVSLVNLSEEVTILNNNGYDTYIFTDNGEFTFEYIDKVGNKGFSTAKVDWIDKKAPIAFISSNKNDNNVEVKLISVTEEIIILNNDGKDTYIFTDNGEFTFIYQDKAGNVGYTTAKVSNIANKNTESIPEKGIENFAINKDKQDKISEETIKPIPKPEKKDNIKEENKQIKKKRINYLLIFNIVLLIVAVILMFKVKKKNINL